MKKEKKLSISLRTKVTFIASLTMFLVCVGMCLLIFRNVDIFILEPARAVDATYSDIYDGQSTPISPDSSEYSEQQEVTWSINVDNFYKQTFWSLVLLLLFGMILIYFVMAFSLRPLKLLQKKISHIGEHNLSERIDHISGCTEIDALSQTFDQLLERLETAFVREKNFSTGAAHELKTPLTVIKTNLDVLELSDVPTREEYEETITIVKKQTDRMEKLVEDLFAMCSLNGYEISERVDIETLIHEIVAEHQMMIQEKNIRFEIHCEPCTVLANSVMLRHALSNLVQNAVKYNLERGEVCVQEVVEQGCCFIRVSDHGIGISPSAAKHIFEPFFREDKSRSRKIGGAGLGLSITKTVIEQHGGIVWYEPNKTGGASFMVKIPIET